MEPYVYEAQQRKPEESRLVTREDALFVLFSFLTAFLFCEWILFGGLGISVVLFYLVFYALSLAYLRGSLKAMKKSSLFTAIPVILLLLCFVLYDNPTLRVLNFLALWGFTAVNLQALAGRPLFWPAVWFDVLKTTVVYPLIHIGSGARSVSGVKGSSRMKTAAVAVLALIVVSPAAMIVMALLMSSDPGFERIARSVFDLFSEKIGLYLLKIVFALILTFPLFSLLYSLRFEKRGGRHPLDGYLLRLSFLPTSAAAAVLGMFSVLYALYMSLQADYFFSALRGVLPEGFTYSEYARRGFFELIGVAFVNFCLIAAAVALTRRAEGKLTRGLRGSVLVISGFTLLLLVTAASKMALYIGAYGLSPLRVYTSWLMLVMMAATVLLCAKMIRVKLSFLKAAFVGAAVFWLLLNFADTDRLIAKTNIALYTARPSGKLDVAMLEQLSDSAVPELASLSDDPTYGREIRRYTLERSNRIEKDIWQDFSIAQAEAQQAIRQNNS